VLIEKVALS